MEQTWEEGKIRALQEISARLCHLHHEKLQPYSYYQFGRRGKDGVPVGGMCSGAFTSHSEDMETILFTTQMSLERARDKVDRRNAQLKEAQKTAKTYKRKHDEMTHKYEAEKKETERLRRLLDEASETFEDLEGDFVRLAERVEELEDEGDDLQAGEALVMDEEDYDSDTAEGERYHEMKDFIVEDDEEEEDPEEPSWDSAQDDSSDSTRRID